VPLLIHTRSGHAAVRLSGVDGEQTISPGDTVLWVAGAPQDFGCQPGSPWDIVWAHFRPPSHWGDRLSWPTLASSLRVGAIAEITGFSSQFCFAHRFRASTGVSPTAWRQALGSDQRPTTPSHGDRS